MKTTQAAIMTAMSVGSPRASERLKTTSAATPMSAMNGVSWWLGTIAAKMRISAAMSAARWPPKRAMADGVPAGAGAGNQRTTIADDHEEQEERLGLRREVVLADPVRGVEEEDGGPDHAAVAREARGRS